MSGFTALNVEPEDNLEEEIDDTKEIQLEEAFKLYQNALKFQSQGPQFYAQAFETYQQLFRSDVFKYPEVISEYAEDQLDEDADATAGPTDIQTLSVVPTSITESTANSLPQLIYLSYKNRGQFVLDVARHLVQSDPSARANAKWHWVDASSKALKDFAQALEHDDTDIDLWKKAARVAEIFASHRIVRFCLESVLAGDDDGSGETIDLSGLDEAYAAGELGGVIRILNDDLSQHQSLDLRPKQPLLRLLKARNDPFPFLPLRPKALEYVDDQRRPISFIPTRHVMRPSTRSWLAVGQSILQALVGEQSNIIEFGPGGAVVIELPESPEFEARHGSVFFGRAEGGGSSEVSKTFVRSSGQAVGSAIIDEIMESPLKEDLVIAGSAISGSEDVETKEQIGEQSKSPTALPTDQADQQVTSSERDRLQQSSSATGLVTLPTRKRSSTVAGNDEAPEARTKSKRLRARESIVENSILDEEVSPNLVQYYQDQLENYALADQWMLTTANALLSKLGLDDLGSPEDLRRDFDQEAQGENDEMAENPSHQSGVLGVTDFRQALMSWSDEKSNAVLSGHANQNFEGGTTGLTLFLQHSKVNSQNIPESTTSDMDDGLASFTSRVNCGWSSIHDVTFALLESMLCPSDNDSHCQDSSYMREKWSDELKQNIVQIIVRDDEYLYQVTRQHSEDLKPIEVMAATSTQSSALSRPLRMLELIQSLFELHLDIYCSITNPSSQVDTATRLQQRDRLGRWADLACAMLNHGTSDFTSIEHARPLLLRFIWASTTFVTKSEEVLQDHVMLCLQDLRDLLDRAGKQVLTLPNNAAMPEISMSAVEQEMSRLSTLDFFTSVFDNDNSDAVGVIESLEPILEASVSNSEATNAEQLAPTDEELLQRQKLIAFLESGDASLKIFLWKRLQSAYQSISYTPKVISCQLRALETILQELDSVRHAHAAENHRQVSMLKWLRDADDLVAKIVPKAIHDPVAFEFIDEDHLRSSINATVRLARLLHTFALYEDSVRVGQIPGSIMKSASSTKLFEKSKERLRDMQVRSWTLLYALLKEATVQFQNLFEAAADDLAGYLRSVHAALGIRQYCKYANKTFLKLVKAELLATTTEEDYSADISQVLFDLHQLKFAPGLGDTNHGCPAENLDKKTAAQLVPVVMVQANRLNIRDLIKSDLKTTIDKVQHALGVVKSSPVLSYNKRTISSFLKSAVNPKDLYRCVRGIGDLPTKAVQADSAVIADHGWYFLLGNMALAKFKSVKRVNPSPTDELDIAASFFRQDLEHGIEKWETWYRLAQIFEAKIEDDLIWNSTKLNEARHEITTYERNAIHAFSMSAAVAMRNADDAPETAQKISDMFLEFGVRLYSSSREPLNMEAFKNDKQLRHFSNGLDQTMYKAPAFKAMERRAVWNFAAYLLRQKITDKPKHWMSFYTLGKCLWKAFCLPENEQGNHKVSVEEILEAFMEAIEALPQKKEKSNEYILEPHFKLVSIVYKMVQRRLLTAVQGVEYLQTTPYARKVHLYEDEMGPEWNRYILDILKKLGSADKSNWHHRISARAAQVRYEDNPGIGAALEAKHEFTQQIFTKTMTLQVWKPEYERPGRHYVYTGRYVLFFVSLLNRLNERTSLDQLLRRIRRRPTDFLDHPKIWEEVTVTYTQLLRRLGKIPEGHDRIVFDSVSHETFTARAEMLEKWTHDPDTTSTLLDILRDAVELKRLNNSLMKGTMIDDLVVDTYATMYETFVSRMPPEEHAPQQQQPPPPPPAAPVGIFVTMNSLTEGTSTSDGRMSLGNFLVNQSDGPSDYHRAPFAHGIGLGLQNSPIIIGTPPPLVSIEPPRLPTPVKLGRPKQITKREIQRKAEAAIVKPPPIKTPILAKKPIVEIPTSPGSERTASISFNVEAAIDAQNPGRLGTRMNEIKDEEEALAGSRDSSRAGSVHDSADDESELSDVEEMDDDAEKAGEEEDQPKQRPRVSGQIAMAGEVLKRSGDDGGRRESDEDEDDEEAQREDRMDLDDEMEIQDSQDVVRDKMEEDEATVESN